MFKIYGILLLTVILQACQEKETMSSIDPINWDTKRIVLNSNDSLIEGRTYLSVYSQIYSQSEHIKHDLTATISMRNANMKDTIYIKKADFYDTKGKLIRTYFKHLIYVAPMETLEIIIDELDQHGGTGANFIFDWQIKPGSNEPIFESVMISTSGQQGISFTTQGTKIH